jgi:hypothetical protein
MVRSASGKRSRRCGRRPAATAEDETDKRRHGYSFTLDRAKLRAVLTRADAL